MCMYHFYIISSDYVNQKKEFTRIPGIYLLGSILGYLEYVYQSTPTTNCNEQG